MFRSLVILSATCLMGTSGASTESANTTKAMLTTIFEGDVDQSESFLAELSVQYRTFLNHWVTDGFCTQTVWGDAAERACRRVHALELSSIDLGTWNHEFLLSRAEFNRYLENKNVGTYNFTRKVNVLESYQCVFTMQITAILNVPRTPANYEFFAECSAVQNPGQTTNH